MHSLHYVLSESPCYKREFATINPCRRTHVPVKHKYTEGWEEMFALVGIILASLESVFPLRSKHLLLPGTADWNQTGRIQQAMNHNRVCISRLLVHASSDQRHSARHTKTCSANAPPDVAYS